MADAGAPAWRADGAWGGIAVRGRSGRLDRPAGVTVELMDDAPLASLITPAGDDGRFARRMSERFGIDVPERPRFAVGEALDLVWAGRNHWLARSRAHGLVPRLVAEIGDVAAISDQTSSRAMLRLSGPHARETLAKGCAIDLHPRAFAVGDVAVTAIAHIGIHLWRPDEASFEAAVMRSYAGSFWSWLAGSAAEFGLEVTGPS